MNHIISKFKSFGFLPIIFYISIIAIGAFHEYVSCILSVILSVYLVVNTVRKKQIKININLTTVSASLIVFFYLISIFWAVDAGMAFIGFLKYLPLLLFTVSLLQDTEAKDKITAVLPCFAAVMTVVSAILMQIPAFSESFSVAGRLAGFFQYPNTFALFLLICELLVLSYKKMHIKDYVIIAILLFGILYSGSRTVFVLAAISNIIAAILSENKPVKITVISIIAITAAGIAIYAIAGGNDVLSRFTSFSFKESTFIGRILYFYDALPIILKNPFGLGYSGYYYLQQEFQTGVYSVMFIHNDFLQLMLDIGWIPAIAFAAALIKPIFSRNTNKFSKLIIMVMLLHSCFDFNLQFIAIFFLYILFTDFEKGKEIVINKNLLFFNCITAVFALISFYMAIPLTFTNFGAYQAACSLYPYNTKNDTLLLTETVDISDAKTKAEEIIDRNPYVTLCYSVRSRYYYSEGNFELLIKTKKATFKKFPFQYSEYEEYCYMLINGISLYSEAGDFESAEYCLSELLKVPEKLEAVTENLSSLGKLIKDQPTTELPEDIMQYIAEATKNE